MCVQPVGTIYCIHNFTFIFKCRFFRIKRDEKEILLLQQIGQGFLSLDIQAAWNNLKI